MGEIKITINEDWVGDKSPVLYKMYSAYFTPQPVYIILDEKGRVHAERAPTGYGISSRVYKCRSIIFPMNPMVSGETIVEILKNEKISDLLQKVHDGHEVPKDEESVGRLTEEAEAARRELAAIIVELSNRGLVE